MLPADSAPESPSLEDAAGLGASPPAQAGSRTALWTWLDLVRFLGLVAAALVVSDVLVVGGYTALQPLFDWHLTPRGLQTNPFVALAFQSVLYSLVVGGIYFLVAVHRRQPFWEALRWRRLTASETRRLALIGTALAVIFRYAPAVLPEKDTFPLESLFTSPAAGYAIAAFAVVVAPIAEELIFRGFLFSVFEQSAGLRFAVGASAVLFAALHVQEYWGAWNHVLLVFVVGLACSMARGWTGSLASSVILHLSYNAGTVALFFVETQHFRTLHAAGLPGL